MLAVEPAKILVVDDQLNQRLATEVALAELGEQVVSVDSGGAALRLLLDHEFAVVLLDVNMPDIDGFETAGLIRQRARTRHLPIIFLTADSDDMRVAQGYSLGAVDYIVCPFAPEVLRAKVRVFVELSKAQARLRREAEQRVALSRAEVARAAAEEESRRLRALVDISGVLGRTLAAPTLMVDLVGRLVPRLATVAAAVHVDAEGAHAHWAASDVESEAIREPTAGEREALQAAIDRVLAGDGESALLGGVEGRAPGVVLPLIAQGRVLGALGVANHGSGYGPAELELLRLVAGRAAAALENCRLYHEIQARDRHKDEFLAMISHELRNPLGAITTAMEVLDLAGGAHERSLQARGVIRRQSAHLVRMVDDLLDLTRLNAGRFEVHRAPLRLDELVERAVAALRDAGRLQRHALAVRTRPVMVDADNTRLEQVVTNLLVNAIKYTDPGGAIEVEVEIEDDEAVVRVRDSGVGIGTELLPHVFDLFTQARQTVARSQGGLGIGLTLVRRLIELHDGRIEATSDGAGKGSTFTVHLPQLPLTSTPTPTREAVTATAEGLQILLIEDNADARTMLCAYLKALGHVATAAEDGVTGLEAAIQQKPQLALVDLGLPGIDGFGVAAGVRAAEGGQDIVLVALSGYGQASDRRRALASGFDAHLVKPVDARKLALLLSRVAQAGRDPAAIRALRASLSSPS